MMDAAHHLLETGSPEVVHTLSIVLYCFQSQFWEIAICYDSLICLSGLQRIRHLPICILHRALVRADHCRWKLVYKIGGLIFDCTLAQGSIYTYFTGVTKYKRKFCLLPNACLSAPSLNELYPGLDVGSQECDWR